jgi:hypothetical protein
MFELFCKSCSLAFPSLVATSEQELLEPDFDQLKADAGELNASRFHDFWWDHYSHDVIARPI